MRGTNSDGMVSIHNDSFLDVTVQHTFEYRIYILKWDFLKIFFLQQLKYKA